jgi:hypothetical protein
MKPREGFILFEPGVYASGQTGFALLELGQTDEMSLLRVSPGPRH